MLGGGLGTVIDEVMGMGRDTIFNSDDNSDIVLLPQQETQVIVLILFC